MIKRGRFEIFETLCEPITPGNLDKSGDLGKPGNLGKLGFTGNRVQKGRFEILVEPVQEPVFEPKTKPIKGSVRIFRIGRFEVEIIDPVCIGRFEIFDLDLF